MSNSKPNPYASPQTPSPSESDFDPRGLALALIALAIASGGLLIPAPSFWELYNLPVGTAIRPMGLAMMMFICGFGTPLFVLPLGYSVSRRRKWLGISVIAMSLLVLPLHYMLFFWIVNAHKLTLKP